MHATARFVLVLHKFYCALPAMHFSTMPVLQFSAGAKPHTPYPGPLANSTIPPFLEPTQPHVGTPHAMFTQLHATKRPPTPLALLSPPSFFPPPPRPPRSPLHCHPERLAGAHECPPPTPQAHPGARQHLLRKQAPQGATPPPC